VEERERTDVELFSAYRSGAAEAFSTLYRRYRRVLYLQVRALCGDDAVAEDVVSETFLRLFQAGDGRLSVSGSLGPFLYRVARNLALDRRRSESALRRREAEVSRRWLRPVRDDADPLLVEKLNVALKRLPVEQLETVILYIYGQMTFAEVAGIVGEPLKTVASRYHLALQKLAEFMGGGL
jgi:RNA polymerase sigma-70 factor (ECF subfamily)